MVTLERLLADMMAMRDCESTRRLAMDVWGFAQKNGEQAGIELGMCVLDGVRNYVEHERLLKASIPGRVT